MRSVLRVVVGAGLAAYAVALAVTNGSLVEVNLLFATFEEVPAWGVMLGSLLFGAAATAVALAWPLLRLRLAVRRGQHRVARLEQELHGLRTLPLEEDKSAAGRAARGD